MCVQCMAKSYLIPTVLTSIEIFIDKNGETLLPPRLLLQLPRIRRVVILEMSALVTFMLTDLVFLII